MSFNVQAPILSPSLNEFGDAILTDPNGNQIPLIAHVHPSPTDGSNELAGLTVIPGTVSQVTGRRGPPTVSVGGVQIPCRAIMNIGAGPSLSKAGGKFQSTVQTGTGSAQSIAHGLGIVPTLVLVAPYDNTAAGSTPFAFAISEGSHTSTNLLITATSGLKYKVIAFV